MDAPEVDAGSLLRRVRRLARFSQRELAARAGVAATIVSRIESGQVRNPGIRTVERLVRAAGFSLDAVFQVSSGERLAIASHPDEGERSAAGRRFPAHVETARVRGLWEPAPIEWWGWAYQRSSLPEAQIPARTYSLLRNRYSQPRLDPLTGEAIEAVTILDWESRQATPYDQLRALNPGAGGQRVGARVSTIGVFALQGDVREHLRALEAAGCKAVPVRRPSELDAVDALVLPGGESTTMVKLARVFDLLDPLRARIADGMPVYGSCAGMILLADRVDTGGSPLSDTIGGLDIAVRRNAFGRQVDSFEQDIAIEGIEGDPVHAVFIRAPWVQELGPAVQALGRTLDGQVVAVRQGRLLATSFHPEMTGDGRVHAYFCAMVDGAVPLD